MGQSSILGNDTWSSTYAQTFWRTLPPQFQDMTPPQSHMLQKLLPLSLGQSAQMETADFSTLAPSLTKYMLSHYDGKISVLEMWKMLNYDSRVLI